MKRLLRQLLGFIPEKLPTGVGAFDAWVDALIDTYTMPTSDRPSIRFVLASIIMHLGPRSAFKSKFYFYLMLHSSATKQVAGQIFYETKEAQKAAAPAVSSNG